MEAATIQRGDCRCGARRIDQQLGLEPTPEAYLATMVQVFREVRRVLRDDGTCWVNMGDSYNANQGLGFNGNAGKPTASPRVNSGLAPKQLLMMPARLALALQADGWWLRSEIIWAKPNPMPESVTDRPTSAHEKIYLLTKAPRYFYDQDAIRWAPTGRTDHTDFRRWPEAQDNPDGYVKDGTKGRNERNVWTIPTHSFPAAHFATFPPELAERCIRAGTSERGCCAQCGKPWVRVTQASGGILGKSWHDHSADAVKGNAPPVGINNAARAGLVPPYQRTTTGWSPGCTCNAEVAPCVVLDCFSGAGTALLVADRLGRDAIGIDLSHAYVEMARERLQADCPLFADITDAPVPEPPEDERMADLFAEAAE